MGMGNPRKLQVWEWQVRVCVVILLPVRFKTSPRTSKTVKNWGRYAQNG